MRPLCSVSRSTFVGGLVIVLTLSARDGRLVAETPMQKPAFYPDVATFVAARVAEFDQIPASRRESLLELTRFLESRHQSGESIRLNFLCTHNSRRSQFSQVWAAVAANYYGLARVETFSGGTEATACNPRTVAALQRAGLQIPPPAPSVNPRYQIQFAENVAPILCFSKVYSAAANPAEDYCAVMTCSHADENCPVVQGSTLRIALPFEDPKIADGTAEEPQVYDERCRQIARELLFAFSQVRAAPGRTTAGNLP